MSVFDNRLDLSQYTIKQLYEKFDNKIDEIELIVSQQRSNINNFSVNYGWLGYSLFYCMLAKLRNDESYFVKAEYGLDNARKLTNPKFYKVTADSKSYEYELAELGLFYLFCEENNFISWDVSHEYALINESLITLMKAKIIAGDFSQFSGALAPMKYFLKKDEGSEELISCFEDLANSIYKYAKRDADGDFFWESPLLKNRVYLGSTHGSGMVVMYLAALVEKGIAVDQCLEIIKRATNFVLKEKRGRKHGLYPDIVGEEDRVTQLSQCYGDLGVGYSLLRAGQVLKDQALLVESEFILTSCTLRCFEDKLTHDAGMTYGASGVAQFFDKIAQVTNNHIYIEASRYWYHQILRYDYDDKYLAGFIPKVRGLSTNHQLSYSWGIIGIGLSLMQLRESNMPRLHDFNKYI